MFNSNAISKDYWYHAIAFQQFSILGHQNSPFPKLQSITNIDEIKVF